VCLVVSSVTDFYPKPLVLQSSLMGSESLVLL